MIRDSNVGGFRQQTFVLSQFWKPKGSNEGRLFLETLRETLFPASLLASGGRWRSLVLLGL